jgi:GNAT superfamily N-acetyltransferase
MIAIPFKNFLIERIPIWESKDEIKPLHEAHYAETETRYKKHTVAVNYAHMGKCDDEGTMRCFGARLVDSERLVAYLFVYINHSAHDSSLCAVEDAYYVLPEYRGSGLARRLLQYSEKRLKEMGADYFFMSSKAPVGGPNIGMFLETEGFKATAVVYSKAL